MSILKKMQPEDVFTPRAPVVNPKIYVDRSGLEARLFELISATKHVIVHGESGNGKSWLYKKVFSDNKIPYITVNLANAIRHGSISKAMKFKIDEAAGDQTELAQIVVNFEGGLMPSGVGIKAAQQRLLKVIEHDPLVAVMKYVSEMSRSKFPMIVFDNFEVLVDHPELVRELSSMIVLLDDEDLAKYNTKFCIVGVPSGIRDYLSKASNSYTITNRLSELEEVARLSREQVTELLDKGFTKLLKIEVDDARSVYERIMFSTDRIAEHVHELSLEIAREARRSGANVDIDMVGRAEGVWFDQSISASRHVVEGNINSIETKAGRRNQAIFAIGQISMEEFKPTDVEEMVRKLFPDSTAGVNLNIFQTLSDLSSRDTPLIKRTAKGGTYRVINPKARIAIRLMLGREGDKIVEKRGA